MLADRETLFEVAKRLGGVPILGCLPGSPAARAGIRYGDVLLEANGRRLQSVGDFLAIRNEGHDTMAVRIFRDGEELDLVLHFGWDGDAPTPLQAAQLAVASGAFDPPKDEGGSDPNVN